MSITVTRNIYNFILWKFCSGTAMIEPPFLWSLPSSLWQSAPSSVREAFWEWLSHCPPPRKIMPWIWSTYCDQKRTSAQRMMVMGVISKKKTCWTWPLFCCHLVGTLFKSICPDGFNGGCPALSAQGSLTIRLPLASLSVSLAASWQIFDAGGAGVVQKQGITALRRASVFYDCVLRDWIKHSHFTWEFTWKFTGFYASGAGNFDVCRKVSKCKKKLLQLTTPAWGAMNFFFSVLSVSILRFEEFSQSLHIFMHIYANLKSMKSVLPWDVHNNGRHDNARKANKIQPTPWVGARMRRTQMRQNQQLSQASIHRLTTHMYNNAHEAKTQKHGKTAARLGAVAPKTTGNRYFDLRFLHDLHVLSWCTYVFYSFSCGIWWKCRSLFKLFIRARSIFGSQLRGDADSKAHCHHLGQRFCFRRGWQLRNQKVCCGASCCGKRVAYLLFWNPKKLGGIPEIIAPK